MIIGCEKCHRQLDVGMLKSGSKARCFCGGVNRVPDRVPLEPRMMHCRSCGAALRENAAKCNYCKAEVRLSDRGLGEACPGCMRRLTLDSRYCSSCGISIAPQAALKALQSLDCPRCKGPLAECQRESDSFVECTACAGIWLSEGTFRVLFERRRRDSDPGTGERVLATLPTVENEMKYLPCPACRDMMNRINFAHTGVIIDWCGKHGYWFDTHELERILLLVEAKLLEWPRRSGRPVTAPPNSMGIVVTENRTWSMLDLLSSALFHMLF